MSNNKNQDSRIVKCSFCGKPQEVVKKIIAGPGVYICDECVDLCDEILEEEFRFRDAVMDLIQGEEIFTLEGFLTALLGQFGENWKQEKQILLSILVLGIAAALLTNFSNI